MNKIFLNKIFAGSLIITLLLSSCTENFEEFNTNPYEATEEQLAQDFKNVGGNFTPMQRGIMHWTHWKYQLQQNLNGDVYSQFLIPPTPFEGNINNASYGFVEGWNLWPWKVAFEDVMTPALLVKNITEGDESTQHFNAWANILKVFAMHRVSDIYGPVVYSQFGQSDVNIPYDSQEEAYNSFFEDLKSAVDMISPLADAGNTSFSNFDLAYGGDMKKWIKAANSLRLRLAMRLVLVNPSKAKTEFEAALNHKYGVFESNSDDFVVGLSESHPIQTIGNSWLDTRMSATMESYLKGFADPRMEKYFTAAAATGEFKGIRQGIEISSKSQYQDIAASPGKWFETNRVMKIMSYDEVCFLLAEAALRGWSVSGDAKTHYENGVKASFEKWGASGAETYLENATGTAAEYVDPLGNTVNDVTAASGILSDITIKWDDAATNEVALNRIITQKWIALFPDGQEAWSEFRRTGYPKLFPLVVNNSGGEIGAGEFVKRIKFSRDEYETNRSEVDKAITLIGGNDGYNVKLWWDVNGDEGGNNF